LATILSKAGNVLLLDEPTNHLDIQSIEILAQALQEFPGTVLMVSHNEYFISKVANRIIEMRPGIFRDFPGSIAMYHSYLAAGYLQDDESGNPSKTSEPQAEVVDKQQRIKAREERKQLERKIEKIEKEIARQERDMELFDATLHNPGNASNFGLLHETMQKIDAVKKQNEVLLSQWEELQENVESCEET
jgi:ATP-binding cassette, subfamily F, member 3